MNNARIAAVVTWVYAGGFGLPAIPVAVYLNRRGSLPTFMGAFEMYGGPWSARVTDATFVVLLTAYLVVCAAAGWMGGCSGADRDWAPYSAWPCCRSRPSSGSASRCRSRGCLVSLAWS